MISIGAVYRGPELRGSAIDLAITAAARAIDADRGPLVIGEIPTVNAVFVVPGSLGDVGFEGLSFGQYSRTKKLLVVQIAVPRTNVDQRDIQRDFVADSLRGANAMAFEFFRKKGEVFPLREAEALITRALRPLS